MNLTILKKGFNYSQDGRGNRLIYHLQGCNLRCAWCSNPESVSLDPKSEGTVTTVYDVDAIVSEAVSAKALMFDGGGATLTGGEPTLQFEAVKELLIKLKENGIHTAIENNGTHSRLGELFAYIDELIIDFKHYDESKFKQATGGNLKKVKDNLIAALTLPHPDILIRTVLIGEYNSTLADAKAFADFFSPFDCKTARFEFLLYHEYGKSKWEKLSKPYLMTKNAFVTEKTRELFENEFKKRGRNVVRT